MNKEKICYWERVDLDYGPYKKGNKTECGEIVFDPPHNYCPYCGRAIEYFLEEKELKRFSEDDSFLIFRDDFIEKSKEKVLKRGTGIYHIRFWGHDNMELVNGFRQFLKENHMKFGIFAGSGPGHWHYHSYPIERR